MEYHPHRFFWARRVLKVFWVRKVAFAKLWHPRGRKRARRGIPLIWSFAKFQVRFLGKKDPRTLVHPRPSWKEGGSTRIPVPTLFPPHPLPTGHQGPPLGETTSGVVLRLRGGGPDRRTGPPKNPGGEEGQGIPQRLAESEFLALPSPPAPQNEPFALQTSHSAEIEPSAQVLVQFTHTQGPIVVAGTPSAEHSGGRDQKSAIPDSPDNPDQGEGDRTRQGGLQPPSEEDFAIFNSANDG